MIASNKTDKALDLVSVFLLGLSLAIVARNYAGLPDIIPTHFGLDLKADATGGKGTLLFLTAIPFAPAAGIGFLLRYPRFYNFPVAVHDKNRDFLFAIARRLLRWTRAQTLLLFTLIIIMVIRTAKGHEMPVYFLPVFFLVVLSIVLCPWYFVRKMSRGAVLEPPV